MENVLDEVNDSITNLDDSLNNLKPTERELLWGGISATDGSEKRTNFLNYKYLNLEATFKNAGRAAIIIPCAPLEYAIKQYYHLANGEPQNTNYWAILNVTVTANIIQIEGYYKGSGVGDGGLNIYGIK